MSQAQFIAVQQSDLYEYGGCRKALLARIASLIIGPPEEGQEPDPDEGWCVARQDILAAMLGLSEAEVCREIAEFKRDGWLTVKKFHGKDGHERNHYTITPEQLKKIVDRKMKKDADGKYIRAKRPQMARKEKSHANLVTARASRMTNRQRAVCPTVNEPSDQPSIAVVVAGVVPSLVVKPPLKSSSIPPASPENQPQEDSLRSERMKGKPNHGAPLTPCAKPQESEKVPRPAPVVSQNPSPLKSETQGKLKAAGAPPELFSALNGYTKIVTILNGDTPTGCSNPVTAYATFARNNPKFAEIWTPVFNAQGFIDADFFDDAVSREILREMNANMTDKERELTRAQWWWGNLEIEKRHQLATYEDYATDKQVLEAYRGVQAAKGMVKRNESDGNRAVVTPETGTHPHDYDLTAVDDI